MKRWEINHYWDSDEAPTSWNIYEEDEDEIKYYVDYVGKYYVANSKWNVLDEFENFDEVVNYVENL